MRDALSAEFEEFMINLIGACIARRMTMPFITSMASANGMIFATHIAEGQTSVLAEHNPPNDLAHLPIRGLLIDQEGRAVLIIVDEDGMRAYPLDEEREGNVRHLAEYRRDH
jgi:hypothetical protein